MRLISVRVQNYRSVQDSGVFHLDDLTCLVGKNESGKTAILKALHRLNPEDPAQARFDVETEYPRQDLFDYQPRHADQPATVVTTVWDVGTEAADWIEDIFGSKVLLSNTVEVAKGYSQARHWTIGLDEKQAVQNLLDGSGLDAVDANKLTGITDVQDLIEGVDSLEASPRRDAFLERLKALFGSKALWLVVAEHLTALMPKFVYYASYHALPGEVSLNQLVQMEQQQPEQLGFGHKIFKALLSLVGTTPADIDQAQTYEALKAKLEAIGLKLSKEIFDYWSQNRNLEVDFNFDPGRPGDPPPFNEGYVFRTRIKNTRHGVSVSFDERSTGFVWFFSFLVWFSQMQREHGDRLVLLLDEPGLSLHGTAQADLLRYINEKLVPSYQVIYTTHSPFMVDPKNLLSVRTVEDVTEGDHVLGTKVGDEVLSTDAETLFPLRAALGYDITQTMFVGEHSLLVEGPSDLLYLLWASEELQSRGRTGLDRRWTITPCGGIRKVASFLSLFGGHQLHVAVFTDLAAGEKKEIRSLRDRGLLRDGHVLTADMYVDGQAEADIEDLLGRRFYIGLVNRAYGLRQAQRLKAARPDGSPERVVKQVEDHFRLLPADVPEFEHLTPALYLTQHARDLASNPGADEALDRFEALLTALNTLLDQDASR